MRGHYPFTDENSRELAEKFAKQFIKLKKQA